MILEGLCEVLLLTGVCGIKLVLKRIAYKLSCVLSQFILGRMIDCKHILKATNEGFDVVVTEHIIGVCAVGVCLLLCLEVCLS